MTAELHRTLFPCACLNETHLPRCESQQHLVPYPSIKAQIKLEMRWEPNEKIHDTETEERESRLFSMCRDHAIIAAEIARRNAINIKLKLVRVVKKRCQNAHQHDLFDSMTYLIYDGWPTTCLESRPMSAVPTEEFVSTKAI